MSTDADTPSNKSSYAFAILFGLSSLVHFIQLCRADRRAWAFVPIVIGAGMETAGWAIRVRQSDMYDDMANGQTILIVIAPTLISATLAICLLILVSNTVGYTHRTVARPLCILLTLFNLLLVPILQFIGVIRGMASWWEIPNWESVERSGAWITVASMAVLSVVILVEFAIGVHVFVYLRRNSDVVRSGSRAVMASFGTIAIVWVLLLIRNIYRSIQLKDGFESSVQFNSLLFDFLEGLTVLLSLVAMNVFHPARLLPRRLRNQPVGTENIPMLNEPTVAREAQ
ncbi:hypothetical protein BKA62DRAFT_830601 [Auriculariales sp. MPI-PUGE-AT-0066]|nr:hypothetical protein BKA62DRAFT_830601 [Auriculariales sp. MPI-PUGE-AT-0066]